MKYQIFKALDRSFIQKLFEKKSKTYFPFLKNNRIQGIKIEKTSPIWAKETCLVRYKIFFNKNNQKTIRGTAKIHKSGEKTWQIMKYLYSQGFNKKPFAIARPIDFIEEINLILYEEAPGQPLTEILQSKNAKMSTSISCLKDTSALLIKLHTFPVPKKLFRKALFLGSEKYEKVFNKIKKIMPELKDYLIPIKNLKIIDKIWRNEKNTFIHNDFYPGNLIVNQGNFYCIDLDKAGLGPALMDIATLYGSLEFPKEIWELNFSEKEIKHLQETFLKTYCKLGAIDYLITKKRLKKFLAKIYLDQIHYYASLTAKGWPFLDTLTKKSFSKKIKALLLKTKDYIS